MVTILPPHTPTDREWNFRDDNSQHFHGDLPVDQAVVTLTLNWKADAAGSAGEVGRYRLDLPMLLKAGFVRESPRGILLRFQRTGEIIEIATSGDAPSLVVGRRPR